MQPWTRALRCCPCPSEFWQRDESKARKIPLNSPLICQLYMGYDDMGIIEYGSNIGISIRYQSESIPSVIWVKIGYPMKLWMLVFFCVLEISINRPTSLWFPRPAPSPNFDPHRIFLGWRSIPPSLPAWGQIPAVLGTRFLRRLCAVGTGDVWWSLLVLLLRQGLGSKSWWMTCGHFRNRLIGGTYHILYKA